MGFAAKPTALRRTPERPCQPTATERQFDLRSGSGLRAQRLGRAKLPRRRPHRLTHPAHGDRRQRQWGGTAVRACRHGRPERTATTATRDSRRGAATPATGLYGVSGVLFFLGRGCGRLVAVVAGVAGVAGRLLLVLYAGEVEGERGKQQGAVLRHSTQATGGSQPAHRPRTARPGAETSPGLLAAREEAGEPAAGGESARRTRAGSRDRHHRRHGCRRRRTATTERAPAPAATHN